MRRISAELSAGALLCSLVLLGGEVSAGPQWCEEDPEFVVNGNVVDVTTTFDGQYASSVKGNVVFVLKVPVNTLAAVVALPGTVPLEASVSYSLPAWSGSGKIPVVATVSVKASKSFATSTSTTGTAVELTATTAGTSNTTTVHKTALLAP